MSEGQGELREGDGPGLFARVELALTGLRSAVTDMAAAQKRMADAATLEPVRVPVAGNGTVTAGTTLVIPLGTPSQGYRWRIRRLAVTDPAGPRTAVLGTVFVDWYIGRMPNGPAGTTPPASDWVWTQAGAPAVSTFTGDPLLVLPQEHLYAVITGAATTGQVLVAMASIWNDTVDVGRLVREY